MSAADRLLFVPFAMFATGCPEYGYLTVLGAEDLSISFVQLAASDTHLFGLAPAGFQTPFEPMATVALPLGEDGPIGLEAECQWLAIPADDIVDLSSEAPAGGAVVWFHETQLWPTEAPLLASWESLPQDEPTGADGYASADSVLGGADDGGPVLAPPAAGRGRAKRVKPADAMVAMETRLAEMMTSQRQFF